MRFTGNWIGRSCVGRTLLSYAFALEFPEGPSDPKPTEDQNQLEIKTNPKPKASDSSVRRTQDSGHGLARGVAANGCNRSWLLRGQGGSGFGQSIDGLPELGAGHIA